MFCALLTSRYQVSVYRTNGPLVGFRKKRACSVYVAKTKVLIKLKLYKVCTNDNTGLTLAYFTARSNLVAYAQFEWG